MIVRRDAATRSSCLPRCPTGSAFPKALPATLRTARSMSEPSISVRANGLAISNDGTTLFIANTGDDRVLKLNIMSGAVTVFAESINGADGLVFDQQGRLWVAANQNDEL